MGRCLEGAGLQCPREAQDVSGLGYNLREKLGIKTLRKAVTVHPDSTLLSFPQGGFSLCVACFSLVGIFSQIMKIKKATNLNLKTIIILLDSEFPFTEIIEYSRAKFPEDMIWNTTPTWVINTCSC